MTDFCGYLRVSTGRQQASGLGIDAQREAVERHVLQTNGNLLEVFVEVESGSVSARPKLTQALGLCRRKRATLIIARLDRLSRSLSFIAQLLDAGVDIRCADMPEANRVTLQLLAIFAEHERTVIRERTRAALAAAKVRGVRLGANGATLAARNRAAADAFAEKVRPHVEEALSCQPSTLRSVGQLLTERGVPTFSGGRWHPATVRLLLMRLRLLGRGLE
jgi:DNA invertase Pin-like site-specific DNA recombinase